MPTGARKFREEEKGKAERKKERREGTDREETDQRDDSTSSNNRSQVSLTVACLERY